LQKPWIVEIHAPSSSRARSSRPRSASERIAVRAQLLDGSADGVLDTVRRLGFLQLDPIATVAITSAPCCR
jgi:uncharacterized protein YcaQ